LMARRAIKATEKCVQQQTSKITYIHTSCYSLIIISDVKLTIISRYSNICVYMLVDLNWIQIYAVELNCHQFRVLYFTVCAFRSTYVVYRNMKYVFTL
jgi:hypothetical protein